MPTIDVQVHVYERNHAGRPWAAVLHGPAEVTGDQMVAAMDEVGVDGAILVSPYTQYRYDPSYALEVRNKHPGRFAVVKPVDPTEPEVADTIADWKKTPGTVGIRIMMAAGPLVAPDDPGVNRVLAAAAQHSLPVNVLSWGRVEQLGPLAARNPNTRIVIDHLGLLQPFEPPKPAEPWADLPKLVALAKYDNVVVKISGAGTLSKRAVPVQGHLGSAAPHLRCLRHRPLHVGHRLDSRGGVPDLQGRRRCVPAHRPAHRQRARDADGRHGAEGLRVGSVRQSLLICKRR